MSNIAIAIFGTTGGVKTAMWPEKFSLPDPLYQMVDAGLPFVFGRPVYRFQSFSENGGILNFFAVYTKIDDIGGPRGGAFAGAGVFVRNGRCNAQAITEALNNLVAALIKEASNGRQFQVPIGQAAPKLLNYMATVQDSLLRLYVAGGLLQPRRERNGQRAICTDDDWFVSTPAHFFEAAKANVGANVDDYYYATDREFLSALGEQSDLRRVELSNALTDAPAFSQSRMAELKGQYDQQLSNERGTRQNLEASLAQLKQDAISRQESVVLSWREQVESAQTNNGALRSQLTEQTKRANYAENRVSELERRVGSHPPSRELEKLRKDNIDLKKMVQHYGNELQSAKEQRDSYRDELEAITRGSGGRSTGSVSLRTWMLGIGGVFLALVAGVLIYIFSRGAGNESKVAENTPKAAAPAAAAPPPPPAAATAPPPSVPAAPAAAPAPPAAPAAAVATPAPAVVAKAAQPDEKLAFVVKTNAQPVLMSAILKKTRDACPQLKTIRDDAKLVERIKSWNPKASKNIVVNDQEQLVWQPAQANYSILYFSDAQCQKN